MILILVISHMFMVFSHFCYFVLKEESLVNHDLPLTLTLNEESEYTPVTGKMFIICYCIGLELNDKLKM